MGRAARGVTVMKLAPDDEIISCEVVSADSRILLVGERGVGKLTCYDEFSTHHRATGGMRAIRITEKTGPLSVATSVFSGDEVELISMKGRTVRLQASDISVLGRNAGVVRLMNLAEDDAIAGLSLIHKNDLIRRDDVPLSRPESDQELQEDIPFETADNADSNE